MSGVPAKKVCTRHVPRRSTGEWKTDVLKATLQDPEVGFYRFVLGSGPTITIPAEEMRRVLDGCPETGDKVVGPFVIDPVAGTINGREFEDQVC